MAYARPDMDGMACTEDVMRVIPDKALIPSGYLYAFLASKFGVPMITSATYGAIIQHIEPEHIANLPIPRLGAKLENEIHSLVQESARCFDATPRLFAQATAMVFGTLGLHDSDDLSWLEDSRHLGWNQQKISSESLRAMNYDPRAVTFFETITTGRYSPLGSLCNPRFFKGKVIFKRVDCDPGCGIMLLGQRTAFQINPDGRWISHKSIEGLGLEVPPFSTLIPSHGTLGEQELYCRALFVTEKMSHYAFSGDFFRCFPLSDKIQPGYLFAFLRSKTAFRMLRSISIGGKQQEQHPMMMWRLPIPRLSPKAEESIHQLVIEAGASYDRGLSAQLQAIALVERAIEEAV